jgi:hypothetical protein
VQSLLKVFHSLSDRLDGNLLLGTQREVSFNFGIGNQFDNAPTVPARLAIRCRMAMRYRSIGLAVKRLASPCTARARGEERGQAEAIAVNLFLFLWSGFNFKSRQPAIIGLFG